MKTSIRKTSIFTLLPLIVIANAAQGDVLGFSVQQSQGRSVSVGTTNTRLFAPITVAADGLIYIHGGISGITGAGNRRLITQIRVNGGVRRQFFQDFSQNAWRHLALSAGGTVSGLNLRENDVVEIFAQTTSGAISFQGDFGNLSLVRSNEIGGTRSLASTTRFISGPIGSSYRNIYFGNAASNGPISIEGNIGGFARFSDTTLMGEILVNGQLRRRFQQEYDTTGFDNVTFSAALDLQQGDLVEIRARTDGRGLVELRGTNQIEFVESNTDVRPAFGVLTSELAIDVNSAQTELFRYVAAQDEAVSIRGGLSGLLSSGPDVILDGRVAINGVVVDQFRQQFSQNDEEHLSFASTFDLKASDVVEVFAMTDSGTLRLSGQTQILNANSFAAVPEPSTTAFLALSACALLRRRRSSVEQL